MTPGLLAFVLLMAGWFSFGAAFVFRRRPPSSPEVRRDPGARNGLILQMIGYSAAWGFRRSSFESLLGAHAPVAWQYAVAALIGLLAFVSAGLTLAAVRTLGKQWALAARLVDTHELVRSGPYAVVRHPIYTGMLGMLVATALTMSLPLALVAAVILFVVGTLIRSRAEERLLRTAFGGAYDDYARTTSALLPWRPRR